MNRGSCIFLPLHLLQCRILIEAWLYLTEWAHHRRRKWTHAQFRAAYTWENLIVSLPSLMIQTYVLIVQVRRTRSVTCQDHILAGHACVHVDAPMLMRVHPLPSTETCHRHASCHACYLLNLMLMRMCSPTVPPLNRPKSGLPHSRSNPPRQHSSHTHHRSYRSVPCSSQQRVRVVICTIM